MKNFHRRNFPWEIGRIECSEATQEGSMWTFPGYEIREIVCDSPRIVTYRGIRLQDKHKVLLKACKAEHPSVQDIASLRQEYEISHVLDVDGVVKSYALEAWNHGIVLIQEDFGGVALAQAFGGAALEVSWALRIAVRLAAILEEVHRNGIVHHYINPENILMNVSTGQVKVTGFGAAWRNAVEEPTIQEPGVLENILPYISPEQTGRLERAVDYRTDFYSLGVTLYELLTGKVPFPPTGVLELIHAHIAKNPDAPRTLNKLVPQAISDIVLKLLSKNAEARYSSAYGLKTDLTECLTQWQTCCEIVGFLPGRHDVSDELQVPEQIYGRERETNALLEAFARVKDGARVVMLAVGPSGVGKSTLVYGVRSAIVAQGGDFVSGKFDQLQQERPYSAIIQAFRDLVRQFLTGGEERISVWQSTLLNALGVNGKIILDVIPEVRLLIGEQPNVPELTPAEAQNRFTMVLRNFVKALTTPERPLVIFLDDLQWADSASLRLLPLLMAEPESQHLLVLGAYRDNEVSAEHPLPKALEELRNSGCQVDQLDLIPLELPQVNQLLVDLLHRTLHDALPLAELVLTKTHGNPFFMLEFVKSLRSDGLLTFDFQSGGWQWDIAAIRVRDVADNVAELVAKKVRKQKPEIQHVLRWAACIGNRFTLEVLANVCGKSLSEASTALLAAAKEELILPENEEAQQVVSHSQEANSSTVNEYKFIHDQVRQACYALLSITEQEAAHLHVGRVLFRTASIAERDRYVFDVVNHMNLGRAYISQQVERKALAALNLEAGRRAKSLTAYQAAVRYLQIGLELLGEESWENDYKLSVDLSVTAAEAAYLNHDFPYMEDLVTTALGKINNVLDKAKIYEVKLQALISEGRRLEAVQLGLFVLGLLGVKFPAKPSKVQASRSLTKVQRLLTEKRIEELYHLPEMTDPTALVMSRVLRIILNPVFLAVPELLPLVISQQIQVSVTYGNAADSAYFYAQYGLLLCGVKEDIERGRQFAQLALQLLERFDAKTLKAKVYMTTHSFVLPWTRHLRKSIEPLREGYLAALETGDFVYAAYLGPMQPVFAYFCGEELGKVVQELGPHIEGVRRLKQERTQYGPLVYQQAAVNLLECQPQPFRLAGEWYDEGHMLPLHAIFTNTTKRSNMPRTWKNYCSSFAGICGPRCFIFISLFLSWLYVRNAWGLNEDRCSRRSVAIKRKRANGSNMRR